MILPLPWASPVQLARELAYREVLPSTWALSSRLRGRGHVGIRQLAVAGAQLQPSWARARPGRALVSPTMPAWEQAPAPGGSL